MKNISEKEESLLGILSKYTSNNIILEFHIKELLDPKTGSYVEGYKNYHDFYYEINVYLDTKNKPIKLRLRKHNALTKLDALSQKHLKRDTTFVRDMASASDKEIYVGDYFVEFVSLLAMKLKYDTVAKGDNYPWAGVLFSKEFKILDPPSGKEADPFLNNWCVQRQSHFRNFKTIQKLKNLHGLSVFFENRQEIDYLLACFGATDKETQRLWALNSFNTIIHIHFAEANTANKPHDEGKLILKELSPLFDETMNSKVMYSDIARVKHIVFEIDQKYRESVFKGILDSPSNLVGIIRKLEEINRQVEYLPEMKAAIEQLRKEILARLDRFERILYIFIEAFSKYNRQAILWLVISTVLAAIPVIFLFPKISFLRFSSLYEPHNNAITTNQINPILHKRSSDLSGRDFNFLIADVNYRRNIGDANSSLSILTKSKGIKSVILTINQTQIEESHICNEHELCEYTWTIPDTPIAKQFLIKVIDFTGITHEIGDNLPYCSDFVCNKEIGEDQIVCPLDCYSCGDDICDSGEESYCYDDCLSLYQTPDKSDSTGDMGIRPSYTVRTASFEYNTHQVIATSTIIVNNVTKEANPYAYFYKVPSDTIISGMYSASEYFPDMDEYLFDSRLSNNCIPPSTSCHLELNLGGLPFVTDCIKNNKAFKCSTANNGISIGFWYYPPPVNGIYIANYLVHKSSNKPPVITSVSSDRNNVETGVNIKFTGAAIDKDGTITSQRWFFGDGHASSSNPADHNYLKAGTYTAIYTVYDDSGQLANSYIVIYVTRKKSS